MYDTPASPSELRRDFECGTLDYMTVGVRAADMRGGFVCACDCFLCYIYLYRLAALSRIFRFSKYIYLHDCEYAWNVLCSRCATFIYKIKKKSFEIRYPNAKEWQIYLYKLEVGLDIKDNMRYIAKRIFTRFV